VSEDFMEGLNTHELTVLEYKQIIAHCQEQLERLKFTEKDLHELLRPLREALCPSLEYERDEAFYLIEVVDSKDETSRIMEEDRD